jgi:hypothetical protein
MPAPNICLTNLESLINLFSSEINVHLAQENHMKTIPTNEIPGPPFPCPECATGGTRTTFSTRQALGTHRLHHGVQGTSTGSLYYKKAKKAAHKYAKFGAKRTYSKKIYTTLGTKLSRPHKTTTSHIAELLGNPAAFASNLDSLIFEKQAEVDRLQSQLEAEREKIHTKIQELNKGITFLEKFRTIATETRSEVPSFQDVA